MNLLDLLLLLIGELVLFFLHTPLGATVIITTAVIIAVRYLRGERIPAAGPNRVI
jgi:hypothetical protein